MVEPYGADNVPGGPDRMVISARQGIEIDYCPTCRGVWLDRGELDKIIERSGVPGAGAGTGAAAAAARLCAPPPQQGHAAAAADGGHWQPQAPPGPAWRRLFTRPRLQAATRAWLGETVRLRRRCAKARPWT